MNKLLSALSAAAVFFFWAAPAWGDAACGIPQGYVDDLRAAEAAYGTLDYQAAIRNELSARKTILNKIADCAAQNARNLKSGLESASPQSGDAGKLQAQISGSLDEALNYYAAAKAKIGDLGIQGTKDWAKSLVEWRGANYFPLEALAADFLAWNSNQPFFQTAQARFSQINFMLNTLNLVDDPAAHQALESANGIFRSASAANSDAERFLSLNQPDEAQASIKSSLQYLADAYKKLFDVSSAIAKIFPQQKQ